MPDQTWVMRPSNSLSLMTLGAAAAPIAVLFLFFLLAARDARADDPPSASQPVPACNAWDVEYAINATLTITDTSFGAGNGTWPIGPGRAVVRFDNQNGAPGGAARLLEYRMHDHLTLKATILLASANITADSTTVTTPDACGVSADGVLSGRTLRWRGPWNGMRSDGTLFCDGGLCGKFGAPPAGESPVHVAPHPASFKSFEYADDLRTFTMADSIASKQESPSQTSHVTLAGREVKRTCVVAKPCP